MTDQNLTRPDLAGHGAMPVQMASLPRRFFSYLIDSTILGLAEWLVSLLIGAGQARVGWSVIWGILAAAYFIWPYSAGGQTLGKRLLKIKVVSIDGTPLGVGKGILRSLGYALSAAPLGLGFLWAIWDRNRQAGHDKIAGTCVVPIEVAAEELQGTIEPSSVRRTQRRWLVGLGIPALLILVGSIFFVQRGVGEVREMGPWPGPQVLPEDVVLVDLSGLGLEAGDVQDARGEDTWAGASYEKGSLTVYSSGATSPLAIWALRYETRQAASDDYRLVQMWATQAGNCGRFMYAFTRSGGVLHCQYTDAYFKTFWNDRWLVHIEAFEGAGVTPEVLVDQARDAVAAHWKTLAQP